MSSAVQSTPLKTPARVYWSLVSLVLLVMAGGVNDTAINVDYPSISRDFNITLSDVSWVTMIYILTGAIMMGSTAYLLKQFTARSIARFSAFSFLIGGIICALAPSYGVLLVGRIIQGTNFGLASATLFFLIFTEIPKEKLGLMSGLASMAISFSPAIGSSCGGVISTDFSWRGVFWACIPFPIIAFLLNEFFTRNTPEKTTTRFNYGLLILLAIAFISTDCIATFIGNDNFNVFFWILLCCDILFFILFGYVNQKSKNPLFDLSLLRRPVVFYGLISYMILNFINLGYSVSIPTYVQDVLHGSIDISGLVVLPGAVVGALFAPLAGIWADRHGYFHPIALGTISLVIGAFLFPLCHACMSVTLIVICYLFARIGWNITFANILPDTRLQVAEHEVADLNAIGQMGAQFMASFGAVLTTSLISLSELHYHGSLYARVHYGATIAYSMLAVVAVIVMVCVICNFITQRQTQKHVA